MKNTLPNSLFPTPKWQCLNATTLKIIAVVFMFLDHIHQMFVSMGAPLWLTMIGRVVFPIFLFLSADSFHYTRSRKNYLKRLFIASCAMTVLTFLLQLLMPNPDIVLMNNAFGTFFVAALYMQFWDWLVTGIKTKNSKQILKALGCCFLPILSALPFFLLGILTSQYVLPLALVRFLAMLALLIPNIFTVEGSFPLVLLGLLFYIFRKHRLIQITVLLLLSASVFAANSANIQWLMGFAAVFMLLYNGQKGKGLKQFFYIFYPAHISLLYILATVISRFV